MARIAKLEKLRFDGKVITEDMTPQDVWNLSGKPVRVRAIQWLNGQQPASFTSDFGVTAYVTVNKEFLVVAEALDAAWNRSRLLVLNPDGALLFLIANTIEIAGVPTSCNFIGLTNSTIPNPSAFAAIALPVSDDRFPITRRIDIDAETNTILRVQETR